MNVFEAVKQSISTRQAAEHYGIQVRRNGMAVCPFHSDKNPSMKVDQRFHCFGCGADGDVIDFVSRLFEIGSKEAAEKLAEDFGIVYDRKGRASPRSVKRKISEELQFRKAEQKCFRVYVDYLRLLKEWRENYAPQPEDDDWHPLFVEALQKQTRIEYLLDVLLFGTLEKRAWLIAERGKEVAALERRISELAAGTSAGSSGDRRDLAA